MSTNAPNNPNPNPNRTGGTNNTQTFLQYLLPVIALVGLFVCLILDKVQANVAIPVIVGLVGVHVGAAINNNTPNS